MLRHFLQAERNLVSRSNTESVNLEPLFPMFIPVLGGSDLLGVNLVICFSGALETVLDFVSKDF